MMDPIGGVMFRQTLSMLFLCCSASVLADDNKQQFSFGLGIGAMYTGLGVNAAMVSPTELKYLSLGCIEYSSTYGTACGAGLGWIKTDLFDIQNNKHGLGLYVTSLGEETTNSYTTSDQGTTVYWHRSAVYGLGVSYSYFSNGIDKPGFTYGVSVHGSNAEFENKLGGFFQIGYQF
jgi:hypothetical protein